VEKGTKQEGIAMHAHSSMRPTLGNKRRNILVFAISAVAIIGIFCIIGPYVHKADAEKSNTASACINWESSSDGRVFDENISHLGYCISAVLRVPSKDGGTFNIDSGTPPHGVQVCSVSAQTENDTDIIYQGVTGDSTEAGNLCAYMKSAENEDAFSRATQTVPTGLQQDGALETGCKLTYASGVPDGATITLYNPGSTSVSVSQVGVQWISNGIVASTNSTPYSATITSGQVITVPLTLETAISAAACAAGWS
jgi:hypothetical protein